jgi:hypothetical protein
VTRAALAALAAVACACTFATHTPQPGPDSGEWAALRDAATRRHVLYDGVTHRANATVTHLSLPVREARVRRLAVWKSWTAAELERHLAEERAAAAAGEEFVLVFYTAQWKNNDLDGVESIWHVALRRGDNDVKATEIHALDANAELRNLFPWIGPFDTVYTVRFPFLPGGPIGERGYVVELASAVGKVSLDYYDVPEPTPLLMAAPPERR